MDMWQRGRKPIISPVPYERKVSDAIMCNHKHDANKSRTKCSVGVVLLLPKWVNQPVTQCLIITNLKAAVGSVSA